MFYKSTRSSISVTSSVAIRKGISEDGGLFVPESVPWLSYNDLKELAESDYIGRASNILGRFLDDFTEEEISGCVAKAYTREKFETESIAPIYMLNSGLFILELWHGPTCAFKDVALQLLPHLMNVALKKAGEDKTVVILVATSGDTGKAALEGFKDVAGTRICVFYPEEGVSNIQKLQMITQEGGNVNVCAVKGNFDDVQGKVKEIFTDTGITHTMESKNMMFSSANSINWGRLVPQIVYYVSAYCDLIKNGKLSYGELINVVVPTGNFGNILAAYYAQKMGIPIQKLICASNSNNVLTDFLKQGVYNRNRRFYTTISPSMDILVSSNLERLLYDLSACDEKKVCGWMKQLSETGAYEVDDSIKNGLKEHFWAGYCDDEGTKITIRNIFQKYSYVCDPHTAVALNVYAQYLSETSDTTKTLIASTASPFKFSREVLGAIGCSCEGKSDFELIRELAKASMFSIPKQLTAIEKKQPRFYDSCDKDSMKDYIIKYLGL